MTHSSAARRWKYNHFIMSRLFEHLTKKKICIICIMCAMAVGPTAVTGTIDWRDEQCYVPATQSACGLYFTTHTTRQINSDCSQGHFIYPLHFNETSFHCLCFPFYTLSLFILHIVNVCEWQSKLTIKYTLCPIRTNKYVLQI